MPLHNRVENLQKVHTSNLTLTCIPLAICIAPEDAVDDKGPGLGIRIQLVMHPAARTIRSSIFGEGNIDELRGRFVISHPASQLFCRVPGERNIGERGRGVGIEHAAAIKIRKTLGYGHSGEHSRVVQVGIGKDPGTVCGTRTAPAIQGGRTLSQPLPLKPPMMATWFFMLRVSLMA